MHVTLDLDDDVLDAARDLAREQGRSTGAVVTDLARRGLMPARIDHNGRRPIIRAPAGAPAITPGMVRRALGD